MKWEISKETFYENGNIHQRFTYKDGTRDWKRLKKYPVRGNDHEGSIK